jgi:hypothetical protein
MSDLSLRQYIQQQRAIDPSVQGVRSCYYSATKRISVRTLLSAPRIIHISDLHFTPLLSEWQLIQTQHQDSARKSDLIASWIINNAQRYGAKTVIITDGVSGDDEVNASLRIAFDFIKRLKEAGFFVFSVPGNHDYCTWGNQLRTIGEKDLRNKFIDKITPCYSLNSRYPHDHPLFGPNGVVSGRLILLDSMQEELDGNTDNNLAQGTLGDKQLYGYHSLDELVTECQGDRQTGYRVVIALHHSPFSTDENSCLSDRPKLLNIIKTRIDCLLFGHTTPDPSIGQQPRYDVNRGNDDKELVNAQGQYGIPLVNCENLEYMGCTFPITLLDLGSYRRVVFYARPEVTQSQPVISLGIPITGTLTGSVISRTGEPISRAWVMANNPQAASGLSVITDEEGHYRITGFVDGSYGVRVTATGYEGQSTSVVITGGQTITCDFTLAVGALVGTITGTINIINGSVSAGGRRVRPERGRYTLADVHQGRQQVTACAEGYLPESEDVYVIARETVTVNFRLKVDPNYRPLPPGHLEP